MNERWWWGEVLMLIPLGVVLRCDASDSYMRLVLEMG